jgi:hypothetical protein
MTQTLPTPKRQLLAQALSDIAAALVQESGDSWQAEVNDSDYYGSIRRGHDGLALSFNTAWSAGRYTVSPNAPRAMKREEGSWSRERPSITISQKRTSDAVAKDLLRRLVPDARTWFTKVLNTYEANQEYNRKTSETVAKLEPLTGPFGPKDWESNSVTPRAFAHLGEYVADVQATGDKASIELRYLPADLAREILRLVKDYPHQEG